MKIPRLKYEHFSESNEKIVENRERQPMIQGCASKYLWYLVGVCVITVHIRLWLPLIPFSDSSQCVELPHFEKHTLNRSVWFRRSFILFLRKMCKNIEDRFDLCFLFLITTWRMSGWTIMTMMSQGEAEYHYKQHVRRSEYFFTAKHA